MHQKQTVADYIVNDPRTTCKFLFETDPNSPLEIIEFSFKKDWRKFQE